MSREFRVSFNSPQSGWMSLSLSNGEASFVAAAACRPYDSLRDLIKALQGLLDGSPSARVKWNCEPDEFDFQMMVKGEDVQLRVVHYPNHRRLSKSGRQLFSVNASKLELCTQFWRALRGLHRNISVDEFERNWRRAFPEEEMQQLTGVLRSAKRNADA